MMTPVQSSTTLDSSPKEAEITKSQSEQDSVTSDIDQLRSIVAHDLRSPVSYLKMELNVLYLQMQERENIDADLLEMVRNANKISEDLYTMLDNLLKWNSNKQGKLRAFPQLFNLSGLAEGVSEIFTMLAAAKDIKLNFHSTTACLTDVKADIDMMKSTIRNLLGNAIKFSYAGSEIDVVVDCNDDTVCFSVTDHGLGISEENLRKLNESMIPFTTIGTSNESGSGLGLQLVRRFLQLNGGVLSIQSKEGEGSSFGFSLPLAKFAGVKSSVTTTGL